MSPDRPREPKAAARQPGHILFREATGEDGAALEAALEIYTVSFPARERQPLSVIRERIAQGLNRLFVGMLDDELVFMSLLWPLRGSRFILLDYMATWPPYREAGLASAFLDMLARLARRESRHILIEAEDPRYGTNREERQHRLHFYRRLGARELLGIRYLLPPLQGAVPTDMVLLVLPAYPEPVMPGELVRRLIAQLYGEVYGRAGHDPLLERCLAAVPATVALAAQG